MRSFFAVLIDSYREAISGWILQVMMAVSALFILFVMSISFEQTTLKEQLDSVMALQNGFLKNNAAIGYAQMSVENYKESNPIEPWKSAYEFDFVVTCPTQEDLKRAREAGMPVTRGRVERMFAQDSMFEGLQVTEIKDPKAAEPKDPPKPDEKDKDKKADDKEKKADGKEKADSGPGIARFRVTATGTSITDRLAWPHKMSILFFVDVPISIPPREAVYLIQKYLVNGVGAWIALLISIIITAGFVPNMLSKGALDLILAKPISRVALLAFKYVGGLTFVFLLTSFTALGVWLAIGLRTGIWTTGFLMVIPILTMYFAILYAVSCTAAVLTRNSLVAILVTGIAWFLFWGVGKINDGIEDRTASDAKLSERLQKGQLVDIDEEGEKKPIDKEEIMRQIDPNRPLWGFIPKSTFPVFTALHAVTPRTFQLDDRLDRAIAEGSLTQRELKLNDLDQPPRASWAEILLVSGLFITLMLGLSSWRFITRDG
jgi:ABC-type transport system involved in multi-copper enzyme maturation permease subunit